MRDRMAGSVAAVIWFLGCGYAVVTVDGHDAGDVSRTSGGPGGSPGGSQGSDAGLRSGEPLPASLSGQVTLLGAASNGGAHVKLVEPGMNPVETITDSDGSYFFDALPAGDFKATFSAPGYQSRGQEGTLNAGDVTQISVTLEHSLLLAALAALPDGGTFLGYAPWVALPDGGRQPGSQLFYLDPSGLALLEVEVDGGAGAEDLISCDGGLRFLGFDREGGGVVERIDPSGAVEVDFADPGLLSELALGAKVSRVVAMGDAVFFGTFTPGPDSQTNDWSAYGRGDLGPTPLAPDLGTRASPVALNGRMAGWSVGDAGFDTPVVFAPELSLPIDQVCTSGMTPLEPSLDGERFAFAVFPRPSYITIGTSAPASGPCAQSETVQVFIDGDGITQVQDATLVDPRMPVYPVSETAYASDLPNADGSRHLFIHESAKGTWQSDWEGDVEGWVPLHGSSLLMAERVDGGVVLEAIGQASGASGTSGAWGALGPGSSIPFEHEWSAPLLLSPDNRYVILAGIASVFDLAKDTETPLTLTPVSAQLDRPETTALLVDANGQMAAVSLGGPPTQTPQGTLLEGMAIAASFTPDEGAVVYLGTDPLGNTGLFVQPLP
jgi:hypothetical protein